MPTAFSRHTSPAYHWGRRAGGRDLLGVVLALLAGLAYVSYTVAATLVADDLPFVGVIAGLFGGAGLLL